MVNGGRDWQQIERWFPDYATADQWLKQPSALLK